MDGFVREEMANNFERLKEHYEALSYYAEQAEKELNNKNFNQENFDCYIADFLEEKRQADDFYLNEVYF